MSLGKIVTLFVCIAQRLVSSISLIRYDSIASCNASTAPAWIRWNACSFWRISCTSLRKGILGINSSVDFWYFLISLRALVPGQSHVPCAGLATAWGQIFSSCFTPMRGGFPFLLSCLSFWQHLSLSVMGSLIACPSLPFFAQLPWSSHSLQWKVLKLNPSCPFQIVSHSLKFGLFFTTFHIVIWI